MSMAALIKNTETPRKLGGDAGNYVVAAPVWQGGMVMLKATGATAGQAVPAAPGTGNTRVVGVAQNAAALGERVATERAIHRFISTVANPVGVANIGQVCYAASDCEVTMDNTNGVVAGTVTDVDVVGTDVYVWVNGRY
jgi:hypothetical protein